MSGGQSMAQPSIDRNDILRAYPAATRSAPLLEAVVLDAALDVCLAEIHSQGLFETCRMVFKGGTALRKFHFGHKSRLSFDLDFDAEEGTEALFAEVMSGYSSQGFVFEVVERRGHHSLLVESNLFPEGQYEAKVDFSNRGCWLPPDNLLPLPSPVLPQGVWHATVSIPTMNLEENVAEKMSRWQTKPLIRDLYDIAAASTKIDDMALLAEMYVLKAYGNWSSQLPSRRSAQAVAPLAEATESARDFGLPLDGLVHPAVVSDADKSDRLQRDFEIMENLTLAVDDHIWGTPLEEIASDTGKLAWKANQRIEGLKDRYTANQQDGDLLGAENSVSEFSLPTEIGNDPLLELVDTRKGGSKSRKRSKTTCGRIVKSTKLPCLLPPRHKGRCRSVLKR